jgi:hypothetical protein
MVSNLIYKVTGRMNNKQIVKTAEQIGTDLLQRANKNNGKIQIEDVKDAFVRNIGSKNASKIIISDNLDEFLNFTKTKLHISEDLGKTYFYNSNAAVVPDGVKLNNVFFKIDLSSFANLGEKLNTITHESEHILQRLIGYRALLEKIEVKVRGNKWLQNYLSKYANLMNEKGIMLQGNLIYRLNVGEYAIGFTDFKRGSRPLLEQLGLKSSKEMGEELKMLLKVLLLPKGDKKNLKLLKALKFLLKDESRAYKVGGNIETKVFPEINNITKSEMLAQYFDETIKVLTQEIKQERKNQLRQFFGLKRKD